MIRRPLLLPFVPLYRAILACKNAGYDTGHLHTKKLQRPVLSVGGLSAGGSGKTPVVIAMARALSRMGYRPDILSRGYGRASKGTLRVDPTGDARTFGDEPLLLARTLGCPVYVGGSRYAAGSVAEARESADVHLLDDGFSHRQLARVADILVLTLEDLHDTILPAGNLREPLVAMRRAQVLVLRVEEAQAVRSLLEQFFAEGAVRPVWLVERSMCLPEDAPQRPVAFSGIARPESFHGMLRNSGVRAVKTMSFPDHHRYSLKDLNRLRRAAQGQGADGFLTTAKDAVKLDGRLRAELGGLPVAVAELNVSFCDPNAVQADLHRLLSAFA